MKKKGTARTKAILFRPGKGKGTRLRRPRKSVVSCEDEKKLSPKTQPNVHENPSPVTLGKRKAETDLPVFDMTNPTPGSVIEIPEKVSDMPNWMKERMRLISFNMLMDDIETSGEEEDPYEGRQLPSRPRWKPKNERMGEKECTFSGLYTSSEEEDEDDKFMEEVIEDYHKRNASKTVNESETDIPMNDSTLDATE